MSEECYVISVGSDDQEKLKEFVKSVSGLELKNLEKIINQDWKNQFDQLYLWLSKDLTEQKIICLHGHLDHMKYSGRICNVDTFIKQHKEYFAMEDVEIIKHIPHASLDFPKRYQDGAMITTSLNKYNLKMCDIGVDYLFKDVEGIEIKAQYSRIFCDVERFKDNSKEEMAKLGQGYIYTKMYDGTPILRFGKSDGNNVIKFINTYYDNHHRRLTEAIKSILDKGKKALILDLHSYSDELAIAHGNTGPFPDICIGINDEYCDKNILDLIINKIEEKGYSYKINFPYKGSILPYHVNLSKHKDRISSIKIEVNKRIYL